MAGINFKTIPPNIRKPGGYFEENTANALQGLTPLGQKVCLIAQMTSSGSAAPVSGKTSVPTNVFSEADAALYFGAGSIAHLTALAMFTQNPYLDLTIVGLMDANGAVSNVSKITFSGTATVAGKIDLYIGLQKITTGISVGDTATTVASNLLAAITPMLHYFPFTAVASSGVLTLTAVNGGTLANNVPVTFSISATGVTAALTQTTPGSVDPSIGPYTQAGTALAAISGARFDKIVTTLMDTSSAGDALNIGYLGTYLTFCSSAIEKRQAIGVGAYVTYSIVGGASGVSLTSAQSGVAALGNNGRLTIAYVSYATSYGFKPCPWDVIGAYAADLAAATNAGTPFDGDVLVGLPAPNVQDRPGYTAIQNMLTTGLTPLICNEGDQVTICRAVSTYLTDQTLLDITTITSLDFVRLQIVSRATSIKSKQKATATMLKTMRSNILDVLYQLQNEPFEIVQNVDQYKDGLIVIYNQSNIGEMDVSVPADVVPGLHVIAGVINLILG